MTTDDEIIKKVLGHHEELELQGNTKRSHRLILAMLKEARADECRKITLFLFYDSILPFY